MAYKAKHTRDPNSVIKPVGLDKDFMIVPRAFAQDHDISHFTRSVLLDICSHSEDYETNVATIMANFKVGRDKAEKALSEGQRAGYVFARQGKDESGRFVRTIYHVSTSKVHLAEFVKKMGWEDRALKNQGTEDEDRALKNQGLDNQGLDPSHNERREGTQAQTNERKEDVADDEHSANPAQKSASPLPALDAAYGAIQKALAVHGRLYNRSRKRDQALLDLIAREDAGYIDILAGKIQKAAALKVLNRLQSHKLIEDEDIRTRLLDGEYDRAVESADRKSSSKSSAPASYSAEFEKFWGAAPSEVRLKGKKREAFQFWQQMNAEDQRDAAAAAQHQDSWMSSLPDEAKFAQSALKWLEGECWIALSEEYNIPLARWARLNAEARAKAEANRALSPENEEIPF
jgi:hypothetical protein